MSASPPDGYEYACERASAYLLDVLFTHPEWWELDALGLWDVVDPLGNAALISTDRSYSIDPAITIIQWSVALDVARQKIGLRQLPRRTICVIGVMRDPFVRRAARITSEGRFVTSTKGITFHCTCGAVWGGVSPARLGEDLAEHLAGDAHP